MIELLSPVGDFECLKAAVQNGANAVYFGASLFNARAFASNFDDTTLKTVINYAKLRNVKTHLTLNTLIKENEFQFAFDLAKKAYEYGIDAIIVQDFGLAKTLIDAFPNLEIHASTQCTIHNLDGVLKAQDLGFKRVVLSRELSISEIENICKNSNIEVEVFTHGALCISYSGQCLFSSMIGGRSGNRGKCAQPCRLPYELLDASDEILDKGYLLSTRDLCSLENLPNLIKAGVSSLKIEGRMKSPEYVAIVTKIYNKYINLAYKFINGTISEYNIDPIDMQNLLQAFNRGGFSNGHLSKNENRNLVYTEKQNNMGLNLGKILKFNSSKGLVTCQLLAPLSIGDSISFEYENSKYTISELMNKNCKNIKSANIGDIVTFGRMKGNIKVNNKVYKISDKNLTSIALNSYSKESIKNHLICDLTIKNNEKIKVVINCVEHNKSISFEYDYLPEESKNIHITKEKIISQFSKTQNTCFEFKIINVSLDNNLFIPISILNDIRRTAIEKIETKILDNFKRNYELKKVDELQIFNPKKQASKISSVSLLLNLLKLDTDYTKLKNINKLYIPYKYFTNSKYSDLLKNLSLYFNLYIYMPTIFRDINFLKLKDFKNYLSIFNIKGIVISNLSNLKTLEKFDLSSLDIISNYTLNIYNSKSVNELKYLGVKTYTISPELDKTAIVDLCNNSTLNKELIVYGNIPLMTANYCLLGKSNKCYSDCNTLCSKPNPYFIKDRLGLKFRIIPENGITTIYNSKTSSINYSDFNLNSVRIDILEETIAEINLIISSVLQDKKIEGKNYTNGNLNREI